MATKIKPVKPVTKSIRLDEVVVDQVSVILLANAKISGFPATIKDYIEGKLRGPLERDYAAALETLRKAVPA